jgi:hypothetical protein
LLCYITPELLVNQDERVDPKNRHITEIINEMARGRRRLSSLNFGLIIPVHRSVLDDQKI